MRNIVYYLTGAALFATFCLCSNIAGEAEKEILFKVLSYPGGIADATREELPCHLVTTRQRRSLLYPSKQLFELTLEMEKQELNDPQDESFVLILLRRIRGRDIFSQDNRDNKNHNRKTNR